MMQKREEEASSSSEDRTPRTGADALHAHLRAARSEIENQVAAAREHLEERNERIIARTGRNLILAILIGVGIGGVVAVSLIFAHWIFVILALFVSGLGSFELTRAFAAAGRRIDIAPQLVAAAAIIAAATFAPAGWAHFAAVFGSVVLIIVWRLVGQMIEQDGRSYGDVIADVLWGCLIPVYVPFLASFALLLVRQPDGEWWVLAFIIIAVAADTGAYVSGLTWGKHPMAPRVSPKKTWEGFAGAVVSVLVAGVLLAIFLLGMPFWVGIIMGLVILSTATIGDLAESLLKRDLGIKDMSSWLPGHGGVLDRLDSVLPSAAAAWMLYTIFYPLMIR